jgi:hypothetical protein
MALYPDDELSVARSRTRPSLTEEKFVTMAREAKERFDALPPEMQYWHKLAERISMACSIAPEGVSREQVCRDFLTHEVSEKYADWLLEKSEFRKVVGL